MEKNLEKYLYRIAQNKETIFEELENFFDASSVEIWQYNSETKKALFLKETSVQIDILNGKTAKSIMTRSSLFSNHAISSKLYTQTEDNPFDYNIKSLMITPLEKDKQILGFIRVFINVGKRKNFTRQDVKNLELCENIALDFLQSLSTKKQVEKQEQREVKENQNLKVEIVSLKEKLLQYEKELEEQKQIISQSNKDIEKQVHLNKKIKYELNQTKKEYELLKKAQPAQKNFIPSADSPKIDNFLQKIYMNFLENQDLMSFVESIYFLNNDIPIPSLLNNKIKNSTVMQSLLEVCEFEKPSYKERHVIETLLSHLKDFIAEELKIYKLEIYALEGTPPSLFFNLKIAQSILLRFIINVSHHINLEKALEIKASYSDKILHIEVIFTKKNKKNKFTLFNTKKDDIYNSEQLIYQVNEKMLKSIDANIETSQEEDIYKFSLIMPAYIIKL